MIFISAQPDTYYFLWQLQLQLFNFKRLGISSAHIHILVCHNKQKGLSSYFERFIRKNQQAQFFIYEDTRKSKLYDSSLRPHIITKHFKANPWLENEAIFYHDSDIIFTRLPDFNKLLKDDTWYASDTRSYNDSSYIKSKIGEGGFKGMAKLMGINVVSIEKNDENVGGAQYLLKKVDTKFWIKLEKDCETIYEYLHDLNTSQIEKANQIQAWCTDMWCLWWQAIKIGKKVNIHPTLDFIWANTPTCDKTEHSILHYTGNIKEDELRYFRKNNYSRCTPFYDDFTAIDNSSASQILVEEIKKFNTYQLQNRIDLSDVSFLIPVRIDTEERMENLRIVTNYLHLLFKTNIVILEADEEQKVNQSKLPSSVNYHFVNDDNQLFHRTKYNNILINLSNTRYIALLDTDVVFHVKQIMESVDCLRKEAVSAVYPYDGTFRGVDILMKTMFSKLMDVAIFENNIGKQSIATKRSYGGCVFLNKQNFLAAGGENENLTSWGPDDVERKKRMQTLGFKIERIKGDLYHLPHPRSENSGYASLNQRKKLMEEYFKICKMSPDELKKYVSTWPWGENSIEL